MAQARLEDAIREVVPFIVALILALALFTYGPGIVMWLPNLFFK
jgi:TRAP-type C4-dicarboxylate transport system permease large subunit